MKQQRGGGRIGLWLCVACAVVIAAALPTSFVIWNTAADRATESRAFGESITSIELVRLRLYAEVAMLDEYAVWVLAGVGSVAPPEVPAAMGRREVAVENLVTELTELADGDGATAAEADALLQELDEFGFADQTDFDPGDLYGAASLLRFEEPSRTEDPVTEAFHELSIVAVIPGLVLDEATSADLIVNDRPVDSEVAEAVEFGIEVVEGSGGWLESDPSAPFEGSDFFEVDNARRVFGADMDRAAQILIDTGIVSIDEWVRDISAEERVDPPYPIEEMATRAQDATSTLVGLVDGVAERESLEYEAERSQLDTERSRLRLGAIALAGAALLALIVVVAAVATALRRFQQRASLATVDSLTGLGNRHHLDERTARLMADESFGSHIVVIIDLDRFKIVNDLHGHAAGDAMLVEIAARIRRSVEELCDAHPATEMSTVRLGGDEFLISLHSSDPLSVESVRRRIEQIRADVIRLDSGTEIDLEFSIGVAHADRSEPLDQMMRAADLAVYEDKASRAALRAHEPTPSMDHGAPYAPVAAHPGQD